MTQLPRAMLIDMDETILSAYGRLEREEIRLGPKRRRIFLLAPGRSAAGVLRAGVDSTLHGVVFAIFVQALPCTAEGTLCRVRDTRSLVPRAYGTNRSSSNTSCFSRARARDSSAPFPR